MFKKLLLGAAISAGALAMAASAQAATVFISADHLATSDFITTLGGTVDGQAFNQAVYESPDVLTASIDGGPNQDLLAFCVDIFHMFDSSTPPVTYQTGLLTGDSFGVSGGGVPLSNLVSGQIGYLASLGQSAATAEDLAGIQGAIWLTEYSGLTLSGGSTLVGHYQDLANSWGAANAGFSGFTPAIYSVTGDTQGFVTGGVPEPAAWTLMIGGFGMAGAMLRRRRRTAAAATA